MARVRVYELAKELGVESKVVMAKLQEMGEFVRSASSTVEPLVVGRLREQLPVASFVRTPSPALRSARARAFQAIDRGTRRNPFAPAQPARLHGRVGDYDVSDDYGDSFWAPDDLVTTAEAARMCHVRPATIRQWASRGHLSSQGRRGRARVYAAGDVDRARSEVSQRKPPIPELRHNLRSRDLDALITAAKAARLVGVAPSTIRMWVVRGHLTPTTRTSRPHLFTVAHVLRAARRHRR